MLKDRVVVAALVGAFLCAKVDAAPQGPCLSSLATYGAPIGYYAEFGDFNGDGLDDMVVGESWGSRIHVRLRQADGSFGHAALYPSCSQAGPSCVTDLDGDGNLDVVVQQMHSGGTLFGLHYGDGQGGFGPFISIESGSYVQGVIDIDINGDGFNDLVRTGSDTRVWRRQGASYVADASGVWGMISGPVVGIQDMNGDGSRDVIVASGSGAGTTVHYCDAQFQVISSEQLAAFDIVYKSSDFADYDRDGFLDVASTVGGANSAASGTVVIIAGGPGNYQAATLPCVASAVNLAFVDLHADGFEDLALINGTSPSATGLQILENPCGSFVTCVSWPTQVSWIQSVATIDYNLDGSTDLMCYGHTSGLEVFGNCTVGPVCTSSSASNYGVGCGSPAQAAWSQLAVATVPAPRDNAAHCYDSARGEWVLFGGTAGTVLSDTWLFDGTSWQQVATAVSPPGLRDARMVFDASRGTSILFGGRVASGSPLNDTWEWDGATWSLASPATRPPQRINFGMCYDESRQRTIVFGGLGLGGVAMGDTWEYDGTGWVQVASSGPAPRDLCAMAYDPVRGEAVLVGGRNAAGVFSDTWVWDGSSWAERAGVQQPPGSLQASLAWDPMRAKMVRFGGASAGWATSYGDVWEWDGSDWTATTRSGGGPSPRLGAMMIWDAVVGRMLLFGGRAGGINGAFYGDFWGLDISGGVPLQMTPSASPLIGSVASTTISNAPLPFGGVTLGFSDTSLGGLPILPFSLTGLGMPGCFLWHSNEISGLPIVPVSPGVLSFSAAIPGNANLLGTHVYLQAYCVDPNASPRKLITSNGVDWTIGNQ